MPFDVECAASEHTLGATLNQSRQPMAFHSRTFTPCKLRYSIIEKEATAINDAVRKWSYYLHGRRFTFITDQRAVSFMFNATELDKIKNVKVQIWRSELGNFDYRIEDRRGKTNVAPDTFSRMSSMTNELNLSNIRKQLGHPGISRLSHFVRTKNLPFQLKM